MEATDDSAVSDLSWIAWFTTLKGNEYYVEVDDDFVRDNFNLYGLRAVIDNYDAALEMVLSEDYPDDDDIQEPGFMAVYRSASELYSLVHARFCLTVRGMQVIREKYMKAEFGRCPRVLCGEQPVLPMGHSEALGVGKLRMYCPRCMECYVPKPKYADVDGAGFGPSLPLMFLMTYPSFVPDSLPKYYEAKVFGFRVHGKSSFVKSKLEGMLEVRKPVPVVRQADSDSF